MYKKKINKRKKKFTRTPSFFLIFFLKKMSLEWHDITLIRAKLHEVDPSLQLLFPVHCNMFPKSILLVCTSSSFEMIMLRMTSEYEVMELQEKLKDEVFKMEKTHTGENKYQVKIPPMFHPVVLIYRPEKKHIQSYYPFPEMKTLGTIQKIHVNIELSQVVEITIICKNKNQEYIAKEQPSEEFIKGMKEFFKKK